jgi:hypothetical protein
MLGVDEGRKRVLLIAASILTARKLAQFDGGKRVPATISAITDAVRWAVCSQYRLLKSALNAMSDRAYIGLVRYGSEHLRGARWNLFRFITTKRIDYADEQEVRAFLWIMDPFAGINRHIDADNRVHPLPLTPPHRMF